MHDTDDGAHEPGSLVRSFTITSIDELIGRTQDEIRDALRGSQANVDLAAVLVSRLFGLRMVRKLY